MMRRQDEFRLQCAVTDMLAVALDPAQCFWRSSLDGAHMNVITASKHRRVKGLVRGFPDLQFFPRAGRPFFIELKSTAKKKPDKAQAELHEYLKSLGYRVYVASSVNDVLVALDIQGVPTKVAA